MVGAWPGGPRPDVYGAFGVQAVHGGLHDVQFVLDAGSKLSKTKTEIKYAKNGEGDLKLMKLVSRRMW